MKTRRIIETLGALIAGLVIYPSAAEASAPRYDGPKETTRFIYYADYLTAGQSYTYEAKDLTGTTPDTVLHVLRQNADGTYTQVAANDDCPGVGLSSCVTFTATATTLHRIWVRGYSTTKNGKANLYKNGVKVLDQQDFGGRVFLDTWAAGDTFRAPGSMNKTGLDTMLFLLSNNTTYVQHDDDSGPNLYPQLSASGASSTGSDRLVVGAYPGKLVGNAAVLHESQNTGPIFGNDSDADGITNAMEDLIGGNDSDPDTDDDTIPDALELYGNNGWSFSEWGTYLGRDGFVEIDYMVHPTDPTKTRQPYANLPSDVATIFEEDSGGDVAMTVLIDGAVDWHEVTCFGGCSAFVTDGIDFYTVKSSNFSSSNPERQPYFHYTLWAWRHTDNSSGSSGLAEIWGNDLIVSLGGWSHTQAQQRGTFIHELGHNLDLTHNGNGNNNGNNSTVHESVMNYRYQIPGLPGTGRHTYSDGGGGCATCTGSPKQACINYEVLGQCGTIQGALCDCDLNEWGSIDLNFRAGTQLDGADMFGAQAPAADEKIRAPRGRAPREVEQPGVRSARVQQIVAELEARGEERGRDFLVSGDGRHAYAVCK